MSYRLFLATALLLLWPLDALHAQRVVTFGIVVDGPSFHNATFQPRLVDEITNLLGAEFDARFPEDRSLVADWTRSGIERSLERLLSDPEVDIVLTFGAIASQVAAEYGPLPKPVVAPFVLDADLQGLPREDGSSGVANLTYVAYPTATRNDLDAFREVVRYTNLAVLVERAYLEAVPGLRAGIEDAIRSQGVRGRIVEVGTTIDLVLGMLAGDFDAVYVGFLPQISAEETERLIRFLLNRQLPSYTALGQEWVERGFLTSAVTDLVGQRIARRAAINVQRVLLGEDAATIPVTFTRNQRVSINLATARAIGVSPPWAVMTEAVAYHRERDDITREVHLAAAVREAVARNLDLEAQGYQVAAGAQRVRGARAPLLPQLDFAVDARVIDADRAASSFGREPERTVTGSATFVQQLYSERRWASYGIAKYQQNGRVQLRDEVRLDVILSAATTYLSVLRAKTIERIVQDNLRVSRSNLELAEVRRSIGTAAAGEVARWQSEIARSRQEVITANSIRNVLEIELNRILHRPLEDPFRTVEVRPEDVAVITNDARLTPYLESRSGFRIFRDFMAHEAVNGSPELRRLDAAIAAERRGLTAASRAFYVPDLALVASASNVWAKDGAGSDPPPVTGIVPNDLGWGVGIQLTYPLFTGLARSAAKSGTQLQVDNLTTQRAAAADRVEQRLRSAMHAMGASWANITLARASADAARRSLALVTDSYTRGAASVTDLIDAQNNALLAELDAANSSYAFLIDLMDVERAVGSYSFFITRDEHDAFLDRLDAFAVQQVNSP
jgi:outer membrane protein TolC